MFVNCPITGKKRHKLIMKFIEYNIVDPNKATIDDLTFILFLTTTRCIFKENQNMMRLRPVLSKTNIWI